MKYENLEIRTFYQREGKLRIICTAYFKDGIFNMIGGTAEYINKPETKIEFAYDRKTLYKSREDFPRLRHILNNLLNTI